MMQEADLIDQALLDQAIDAFEWEYNRRIAATESLKDFTLFTKPNYYLNWHHELIFKKLDQFIAGEIKRLIICMPPQNGKSEAVSRRLPAYLFGKKPDCKIISCSYSADLAQRMNRDVQRIIDTPEYNLLFPETYLNESNVRTTAQGSYLRNSDIFEIVEHEGVYRSCGIGGGITGMSMDYGIVDDYLKNREEAESLTIRNKIYEWYTDVLGTREQGDSSILITACMTGDTKVTMEDNTEKDLEHIKPGDKVRSWDHGRSVIKTVLNWAPQGEDDILEIRTGSSMVKCNAKHPFLIHDKGKFIWKRAKELVKGDKLVTACKFHGNGTELSLDEAFLLGFMFGDGWITIRNTVQKGYKDRIYPRRGYVTCVALSLKEDENRKVLDLFKKIFNTEPKIGKFGYARTDVANVGRWFKDHGLNGNAKTKRLPPWIFSQNEFIRLAFLEGFNAADGCIRSKGKLKDRLGFTSCNHLLMRDIRQLARGLGYRVTNLVTRKKTIQPPHSPAPFESIRTDFECTPKREDQDFCLQSIRSIKKLDREIVYDIQVEDTECFIADGLVVHNTRWHEDDLIGRLLKKQEEDAEADQWEVINLPAMSEEIRPDYDRRNGPDQPLWPWKYSEKWLKKRKANVPVYTWLSLYQQRPSAASGNLVKKEQFKYCHIIGDLLDLGDKQATFSQCKIFQTCDPAASTKTSADYFALATWVQTPQNDLALIDLIHTRLETPDQVDLFKQQYIRWKPVTQYVATKGLGISLYQTLKQEGLPVDKIEEDVDKVTRFIPAATRIAAGTVYFLAESVDKTNSWLHDYETELLGFPNAAHDDMVDVTSLAVSVVINKPFKKKGFDVSKMFPLKK